MRNRFTVPDVSCEVTDINAYYTLSIALSSWCVLDSEGDSPVRPNPYQAMKAWLEQCRCAFEDDDITWTQAVDSEVGVAFLVAAETDSACYTAQWSDFAGVSGKFYGHGKGWVFRVPYPESVVELIENEP